MAINPGLVAGNISTSQGECSSGRRKSNECQNFSKDFLWKTIHRGMMRGLSDLFFSYDERRRPWRDAPAAILGTVNAKNSLPRRASERP
jgi:hypothetical protein